MPKKGKKAKEDEEAEEQAPEEESSSGEEEEEEGTAAANGQNTKASFDPPPRAEEKAAEKPKEPAKGFSVEFRAHDSFPPLEGPEEVVYCPKCGMPPDFCQYGPTWNECKPWCMENFPQYYPELSGISIEDAKKRADVAGEKSKEKLLPGGKKKREASPHVTIKKLSRGGRKCVTSVVGLESFGIKLDSAAKLFKKKFACGASVVQGDMGIPDSVEIQGDFGEEVIEVVQAEFKDIEIPADKYTIAADGTKKKGKPGR